jgi:hypothetical protein
MSYEPPDTKLEADYNRLCTRVQHTEQKCLALEAQLAEKDAEIARLREYYESNEEKTKLGIINCQDHHFERLDAARAAIQEAE